MNDSIPAAVVERLRLSKHRLVLAESCTCGMMAARLGTVPGVSQQLCGSFVTYRNQSKIDWLDIDEALIAKHTAVSQPVSDQMASAVLEATQEATISLAITGHLGPDSTDDLDGIVFVSIATSGVDDALRLQRFRMSLTSGDRESRQLEATNVALQRLLDQLN